MRPLGFAEIAKRMSGWTTNLLAAGIVIALGLAVGWQAMAWWRADSSDGISGVRVQLPDVPEDRAFWTRHGPLKVERVRGGSEAAFSAMRAFCRDIEPTVTGGEAGPGEQKLITQLLAQPPLEERNGLALYQPRGELAMVVAVCRPQERIVGWSFALAAGEHEWTLYHFQPLGGGSLVEETRSIAGASR